MENSSPKSVSQQEKAADGDGSKSNLKVEGKGISGTDVALIFGVIIVASAAGNVMFANRIRGALPGVAARHKAAETYEKKLGVTNMRQAREAAWAKRERNRTKTHEE